MFGQSHQGIYVRLKASPLIMPCYLSWKEILKRFRKDFNVIAKLTSIFCLCVMEFLLLQGMRLGKATGKCLEADPAAFSPKLRES